MTNDIEQMFGRLRRGTFFNSQDPHFVAQENYIDGGNYISPVEWTGIVPATSVDPVEEPDLTQHLTAAGDTILANALAVNVDLDGDLELTSTPTIANGTSSQRVTITNVDDTDTLTLRSYFYGNTNLSLKSLKVNLDPGESITLQFSTFFSQWYQQ